MELSFQFESLSAFFWMKGHGPYVWAAYAITLGTMGGLALFAWKARKNFYTTQKTIALRGQSRQ